MLAGLKFAGTKNGNAQELLYEYAVYFLNEVWSPDDDAQLSFNNSLVLNCVFPFEQIKPVSIANGNTLPKGLSRFVDRGSLETCLHLIVLSLSVVNIFFFVNVILFFVSPEKYEPYALKCFNCV